MSKLDKSLLCGLIVAILISSLSGFALKCEKIKGEVLRLHIIANSDSAEDQALKYKIRDKVLIEFRNLFNGKNSEEAKQIATENIKSIEAFISQVITDEGFDYNVRAEITNMYFDTRIYEDTTISAGFYDALRITIGDAEGKNWWCVMFPPMCISAAKKSSKNLEDCEAASITEEITDTGNRKYIAKFAIVEIIENLTK